MRLGQRLALRPCPARIVHGQRRDFGGACFAQPARELALKFSSRYPPPVLSSSCRSRTARERRRVDIS